MSDVWTPLWESYANQSPDPEGTVEGAKNAIVSLLFSKAALYQLCSCIRNGVMNGNVVHNVIHNAKL